MRKRIRELIATVLAVCLVGMGVTCPVLATSDENTKYTINWTSGTENDAKIYQTKEFNVGASILPFPDDPTRPGYEFLGWSGYNSLYNEPETYDKSYSAAAFPCKKVPENPPSGSTTLTIEAKWKPIKYLVHFDGDSAFEHLWEDNVRFPSNPYKPGFIFLNWQYNEKPYSKGSPVKISELTPSNVIINFTSQWGLDTGPINTVGTYCLVENTKYNFNTPLRVSGDPNIYSSGIGFYVLTTGNYAFQ